jgi:transposase-like protein
MDRESGMQSRSVRCPYCGETVEVLIEPDLEGEMVWDCEVCCRPWSLRVSRPDGELRVDVRTDDA